MHQRKNRPAADLSSEQIRELYLRHQVAGVTVEHLADELSCDPEALRSGLLAVEAKMGAKFRGGAQQLRVQHTVRLEEIFRKAIAGYDRSCEDEVTHKRTAQGEQGGDATEDARARGAIGLPKLRVETVTRRKGGNARFLWEARSALSDIRRMWTIKPTTKKKGEDSEAAARKALQTASDEELATLCAAEAVLQRLAGRESDAMHLSEAESDDDLTRPSLESVDRNPAVD